MRHLILLDILHDAVDLGSLAADRRAQVVAAVGEDGWQRRQQAIQGFWDMLEEQIAQWDLPLARVLVFQDGLPHSDHIREIVTTLAQRGSRNHLLLERLLDGGATLVGTEDPRLLLEEHQLATRSLTEGTHDLAQAEDLLRRRDAFIAGRIDATLTEDRLGLCFLGAVHDLPSHLPHDISLTRPVRLAR